MKISWSTLIVAFVIILAVIAGVYIYHSVEGWSYLDSTYFLVITATTIGYGDLAPQTDLGKIVTIFYSLIGIVIVLYLISLISHYVFEKKVKTRITNVKQKVGMYKEKKGKGKKKR